MVVPALELAELEDPVVVVDGEDTVALAVDDPSRYEFKD